MFIPPHETLFPINFPWLHWGTTLVVKNHHGIDHRIDGTNQTLADLTLRFWIIAGRGEIRAWEKECGEFRKREAKPTGQLMAPLPRI